MNLPKRVNTINYVNTKTIKNYYYYYYYYYYIIIIIVYVTGQN